MDISFLQYHIAENTIFIFNHKYYATALSQHVNLETCKWNTTHTMWHTYPFLPSVSCFHIYTSISVSLLQPSPVHCCLEIGTHECINTRLGTYGLNNDSELQFPSLLVMIYWT